MITVRVLFLARLRDLTGRRDMSLCLNDGTLAALRSALAEQFTAETLTGLFAENVRLAVNQSVWNGSVPLANGDEVAFLPPVTGG